MLIIDSMKTQGMDEALVKSLEQWRASLSPGAFAVCRLGGTEPAFSGKFDKFYEAGRYHCVCCERELFRSDAKFNSGSGWPSFFQPADAEALRSLKDESHGMTRIEVRCQRCDAHLGHVFPDGPPPTGWRYCINSVALKFVPETVLP